MAQNGFIENSTTAYSYDANGNLSNDTDKGVIYTYNHLNLPYIATKGTDMVEWTYTAAGEKIRKTTTIDGTPTSKDYHGSTESDPDGYVVYHAEGQVRQVDNALHWEYALRDHLGNTRILYEENNNSLDILQNNQYYAFGMSMYGEWSKQGMSENDYKYNGKELNSEMGLGIYEYGARYYDPAIGRFTSVDPLADEAPGWTPYRYAFNNPLRYIDPDGLFETEAAARKYAEENDIKLKHNFFQWLIKGGAKNNIVEQSDGTFAIENNINHSSISDDAEFGIMTASMVSPIDVMETREEGIWNPLEDYSVTQTLRDGSERDATPITGTAPGPGKFLKGGKKAKNIVDMMKGGSKKVRDRDFGIKDKRFWDYWHKVKQKSPGKGRSKDIKGDNSQEAMKLYKQWIRDGKPK